MGTKEVSRTVRVWRMNRMRYLRMRVTCVFALVIVLGAAVVSGLTKWPVIPVRADTEPAVVSVYPALVSGQVWDTITISVRISGVQNASGLYGFEIQFTWDPAIVRYVSHVMKAPIDEYPEGVLHPPVFRVKDVVDETASMPDCELSTRYWAAAASMLPAATFLGDGTIFDMTFEVVSSGSCSFEILYCELGDKNGDPVEHHLANGLFSSADVGLRPNIPTGLSQWRFDGVTPIPEGGVALEPTVVFGGVASDPEGGQVRLEIELRQIDEVFTGKRTPQATSVFVPSGAEATITCYDLANADYHWRCRARNSRGMTSNWTEFGERGNVDFAVRTPSDFSILTSPSLIVQQGDSAALIVNVASIRGFSQAVRLEVSGTPSDITTTLDPDIVSSPPYDSTSSVLTVFASSTAALGNCSLTVTGTSGNLTHRVHVYLDIIPKMSVHGTVVYVNPPEVRDLTVGATFAIHVFIVNITNLYGLELQFTWDPAIIRHVSHARRMPVETSVGGVLHSPTISVKDEVNEAGNIPDASPETRYWLAECSMLPAKTFNGSGVAFEMTFQIMSCGTSPLHIVVCTLADNHGQEIHGVTLQDGLFSQPTPPAKFNVGDRVRTTADLNVREGPGLSHAIVDTMPEGTLGQIMGGPVEADDYIWWDVSYDLGARGWSIENWLEKAVDERPTCIVRPQQGGCSIHEIEINRLFDVFVGDSHDDEGIDAVRFSTDDSNDGLPLGLWTAWFSWEASSGGFFGWDAVNKKGHWLFTTSGLKEIWVEVRDASGQTAANSSRIFVTSSLLCIQANPLAGEETTFDASSTYDPEYEPTRFEWDFGDGTTRTTGIPGTSHVYSSVGSMKVSLSMVLPDFSTRHTSLDIVVIRPPVLLVHGFEFLGGYDLLGDDYWKPLAEYLSKNDMNNAHQVPGHDFWKLEARSIEDFTVYISDYASRQSQTLSVRHYSQKLAQEIDAIKDDMGVSKVHVVAHSLGGLVTRAYIENEDFETNPYGTQYRKDISKLVMLGTPNNGESKAELLAWTNTLPTDDNPFLASMADALRSFLQKEIWTELEPDSEFLVHLNAGKLGSELGVEYCGIAGNLFDIYGGSSELYWAELLFPPQLVFPYGDGLVHVASALYRIPLLNTEVFPLTHKELRNSELSIEEVKSVLLLSPSIEEEDLLFLRYCSPIELRIHDSQERITGLVDGIVKEEIPSSTFDEENEAIAIHHASDSYQFEVAGTRSGVYTLSIMLLQQNMTVTFTANEIPTLTGATHVYRVDWAALFRGERGVTVQVDSHGDNTPEYTFASDSVLTVGEFLAHTLPDINNDGIIDIQDIVLVSRAYGSTAGEPDWNPIADVAPQHGRIDIFDLVTVAAHYGQEHP